MKYLIFLVAIIFSNVSVGATKKIVDNTTPTKNIKTIFDGLTCDWMQGSDIFMVCTNDKVDCLIILTDELRVAITCLPKTNQSLEKEKT